MRRPRRRPPNWAAAMLRQLDETIRSEMERSSLTGLAIGLIGHGELVEAAAYGMASIETQAPIATDSLCGIMSVTKPMIGTAVMQLRDAGMFGLDDPVNRYLAPVSIKNEWELEAPVTIRQLLTHTAGLPVGIGADPPGRHSLGEYVDLVAQTSWRPGSAMVYANSGYAALGLLIERCSGRSVGDYLREEIFVPLGMSNTTYGPPSGERATGHFVSRLDGSRHTLPMDEWPVIPTSPAGGCWATVLDLAKFVRAHINGGAGVLAPGTVQECHGLHATQGNSQSGMGLGFRVTRSNGRRLVCHGGDGGGFTAFGGFYPDEGTGVALLINTAGQQVARSVIANTALRLLTRSQRRTFPGTPAPILAGVYRSTFWDIEVEARDGEPPTFTTTEGVVVADEAGTSTLEAVSQETYEGEGGMFHGFEVAFQAGDEAEFSGGVYPFRFVRVDAIPREKPIDEEADLTGEWQGSIHTPMGPLAVKLRVESETAATLSTPFGPGAVKDFRAKGGRVEMEFPLSLPGVGDFINFVRLECRGGRLTGRTYTRGNFGENRMPTELDRP